MWSTLLLDNGMSCLGLLRSGLEKHAGPDTRQHGFFGKDNGAWKANRDRSVSFCAILFTPTQSKTLRWKKPSIFPEWEPCRRRRDLVFGRFLSCFVDSASNLATRRRNVRDPTGRRAQELGWKKEMCDPSKMHRDMIGFYSSSREG